jgi:threonine/homoserine/homoserine lactone efflux protein
MNFALAALTFGLAAGLKPGPLGVFVIHQTMSKSNRHGMLASMAPLLTDGPIILLALLLTLGLDDIGWFISGISIVGAIYLATIAYKIFNAPVSINPNTNPSVDDDSGFFTAVKINFLNPSPYIFWLTIGSSYILMGTMLDASIFVICTLVSLCVTKYIVALSIKTLGQRFNPKVYSAILRSLSLPLLVFSIQLLYTGISALQI